MKITEKRNEHTLTLSLDGRLDTTTSPALQEVLEKNLPSITELILDFKKLDYMSSAGLRVLLIAHKALAGKGSMVVRHPNKLVMEVLRLTGFDEVLQIEDPAE